MTYVATAPGKGIQPASLSYELLGRNGDSSLVRIQLHTGRTHQIRVHMSTLRMPVAGDALYGGSLSNGCQIAVPRQMLHASTLQFTHPISGERLSWTAPLWPDMEKALAQLRALPQ